MFLLWTGLSIAQVSTVTTKKVFSSNDAKSLETSIDVAGPGLVTVKATWTGTVRTMNIWFYGPDKPVRKQGQSPLELSYEITNDEFSQENKWRVKLIPQPAAGTAEGELVVSYPGLAPATMMKMDGKKVSGLGKSPGTDPTPKKPENTRAAFRENFGASQSQNPLRPILVPLLLKQIEEKSLNPVVLSVPTPQGGTQNVDIKTNLRQAVNNIQQLPMESKQFHPRYANLKAGQPIDQRQLGRDILAAVDPSYRQTIRQRVQAAFSNEAPRFQLNTEQVHRDKLAVHLPPRMQPLTSQQQSVMKNYLSRLQQNRNYSDLNFQRYFPEALNQSGANRPPLLTRDRLGKIFEIPPGLTTPNYNGIHESRDYYRYAVMMNNFYCYSQNEAFDDEPYWFTHIVSPRFNLDNPEYAHWLRAGELHHFYGRFTAPYEDVNTGDNVEIRAGDRQVFDNFLYNGSASVAFMLIENDFSYTDVVNAVYQDLTGEAEEVAENVRAAVLMALKDEIRLSIQDLGQFDQIDDSIEALFAEEMSFMEFLGVVQNAYSYVHSGWSVVGLLFGDSTLGYMAEENSKARQRLNKDLLLIAP